MSVDPKAIADLHPHIVFLRTVVRADVLLSSPQSKVVASHTPSASSTPREVMEGVDQRLVVLLAIAMELLEDVVRHMGMFC
jgi:hypothetical protein